MRLGRVKILILVAAVLIFALIFFFSSQNGRQSDEVSFKFADLYARMFINGYDDMSEAQRDTVLAKANYIVRKTAHATVYAVLGAAVFLILPKRLLLKFRALGAFLLAVIYAASDEIHQLFVAGRSGKFSDVLIDAAGALFGILIAWLLTAAVAKRKEQTE